MSVTTSDTFPAEGTNDASGGTVAWTSPGNILANDGSLASVLPGAGNVSNFLRARDFGFALPGGCTVEGITVKLRASCSPGSSTVSIGIIDASGSYPASLIKTANVSGAMATYTYGGSADMWASGLTEGGIEGFLFGLKIYCGGDETVSVDYVTISITYSLPAITMLCNSGEYSYTGKTTGLARAYVMPAASGSYAYAGASTTNLLYNRAVAAASGAYAYIGSPAALARAYVMPAASGAYAYSGKIAGLLRAATMLVDTGIYPYIGSPAALARAYVMPAAAGAYAYSGSTATLTKETPVVVSDYVMYCDTGRYAFTLREAYLRVEPIKINFGTLLEIIPFAWETCFFSLEQTPVVVVTGGSPSAPVVVRDRNMVTQSTATVTNNAQVQAGLISAYRSKHPNIATVDANGYATYVAAGNTVIYADAPRMTRSVAIAVSQSVGVTTSNFVDYVAGSLARKLVDDLEAMILGKTVAINGPCFSSFNPWIRNPNNWAKLGGVDLSPLSIQNSTYGANSSPTLITPRHFIQCHHYPINPGAWIQYLADDGTERVCQRNVIAAKRITVDGDVNHGLDMWLGTLDSDVDSFIGHTKFLPSGWESKLPSVSYTFPNFDLYYIPIFMQDKSKGAWIFNWYAEQWATVTPTVGTPYGFYNMQSTQPSTGPRAIWAHQLISGDSGSSGCLLIDGQLVLLAPIGGGAGGGASCSQSSVTAQINAEIIALGNGGGHVCQFVDISSYPDL